MSLITESTKINFNKINNTRIEYMENLIQPIELINQLPLESNLQKFIFDKRKEISDIIYKRNDKLLMIVGPCSIHDIEQAKSYGKLLKDLSNNIDDKILIVMRVYFEKPRTTIGWKGLINDPDLNDSFNVNKGLKLARELLLYLNKINLPCGYEILDTITPQYISDLISWGAIGARTTESQVHRQLVSGLSMPIGFKNGTSGNIKIATDAIKSARYSHCFMGITHHGKSAICKTTGNNDCHIILRGGENGPNYDRENIQKTKNILLENKLNPAIMVDCSHGNSKKNYKNQPSVFNNVMNQIKNNEKSIIGVMLESNINEGNQKLTSKEELEYGISITDSCMNFLTTKKIIMDFYNSL